MDTGPLPIDDAAELTQLRRQARAVYAKPIVVAAILTVLSLVP
jgi:hypothetical protein